MIPAGSIKICSLREPIHADYVVEAGADMFGLIFVREAWRYVEPSMARVIVERSRELAGDRIKAVGVFLRTDIHEINQIAHNVGLDYLQIGYPDLAEDVTVYSRPVIVTMRPDSNLTAEHVCEQIESLERYGSQVAGILLDAPSATGNGGLGELTDWNLASVIAERHDVILAGGLTPENVADAVRSVRPRGVDLSSGVETNRVKDPIKITRFVQNARNAFAAASIG